LHQNTSTTFEVILLYDRSHADKCRIKVTLLGGGQKNLPRFLFCFSGTQMHWSLLSVKNDFWSAVITVCIQQQIFIKFYLWFVSHNLLAMCSIQNDRRTVYRVCDEMTLAFFYAADSHKVYRPFASSFVYYTVIASTNVLI